MARRFTSEEASEFFSRLARADAEPRSELVYNNPYTLLVAVVLSAQATDKGVNKATAPLFAHTDTPQKMVALGEDNLREAIKTIGLFRTKAKNVIALSKALIENHGGDVPKDRPVHIYDVLATIYHQLGVPLNETYRDTAGRPVPIMADGKPISELI